jgi:hypothetical protein
MQLLDVTKRQAESNKGGKTMTYTSIKLAVPNDAKRHALIKARIAALVAAVSNAKLGLSL